MGRDKNGPLKPAATLREYPAVTTTAGLKPAATLREYLAVTTTAGSSRPYIA
jgi:hypothetical protein